MSVISFSLSIMEKEIVGEDLVLEHVSVAGILYVTVDKELLYAHKFTEHVKIRIVFDDKVDVKREKIEEASSKIIDKSGDLKSKARIDLTENEEVGEDSEGDLLANNALSVPQNLKSKNWNSRLKTRTTSTVQAVHGIGRKFQGESRERDDKVYHARGSNSKFKITSFSKTTIKAKEKSLSGKHSDIRLLEQPDKNQKESDFPNKVLQKEKQKILKRKEDICCTYCSQSFKSNREFAAHRKVERKSYPCVKCHKVLQFKAHLMIHMNHYHEIDVSEPSSNSKSDCGAENSDEAEANGKKAKRLKCHLCGIMISNLANLKLHVMAHTGEFAFKCCVCGQQSRAITPHKKHMATHFKFGRVECKICKISFSSRSELSRHQLSHTYTCSLCGQAFPNKTGRNFHYRTFHKNDILKCPDCGRLYSCKKALDSHMKYHRNRRRTQCTVCGLFVFRLEKHMFSHLDPEDSLERSKMYICDKCPKQFKHKQAFQRHLSIHSEEKPYACTECSKQFARSGGLSRHLRTHMPEKPYVCEVCGKACKQLGNLKIHMRIHKDSRLLSCNYCGSHFAQKTALENHIHSVHFAQMNIVKAPENFFPSESVCQMFT